MYTGGYYILPEELSSKIGNIDDGTSFTYYGAFKFFSDMVNISKTKTVVCPIAIRSNAISSYSAQNCAVNSLPHTIQIAVGLISSSVKLEVNEDEPNTVYYSIV